MPTSMVNSRAKHAGFTLVEMLIVILLIGLSLGAMISFGVLNKADDQQTQIRQFANALRLQSARAVLNGKTLGLDFFIPEDQEDAPLAWRWLVLEESGWQEQDGVEVDSSSAGKGEGSAQIFVTTEVQVYIDHLQIEPERSKLERVVDVLTPLEPEIFLYPTREVTAFHLVLLDESNYSDHLNVDIMGRILVNVDAPTPP